MAFIFGSYAKGRLISESDLDVAVYFQPAIDELEWETERDYEEDALWLDLDRVAGRNTDLVVLNRAPAGLTSEILRTGIPLVIKDRNLYLRLLNLVSQAAEDFRTVTEDWWAIKERSHSLTDEDRKRLMRAVEFLEGELSERDKFQSLTQHEYEYDRDRRRNVERWVENIVNVSIDIAKIILASEKKSLPETYAEILVSLGGVASFEEDTLAKLGRFAKLRNVLAHEYLDLRFQKISRFIESAEQIYGELISFAKGRLGKT